LTLAPPGVPGPGKDVRSQGADLFRRHGTGLDHEAGHLSRRRQGFEGVGKLLTALEALVGLFRQAAVDDVLEDGQVVGEPRDRFLQMLDSKTHRGIGLVGNVPGQNTEKNDSQAVQIRPAIQRLAGGLLGAHVLRRPRYGAALGRRAVRIDEPGDAEVGEHGAAVLAEKNVLRLHVPVDEPSGMGVIQRFADVLHHANQITDVHAPVHALQKIPAPNVFEDQVESVVVGARIVNLDDVRMGQAGSDARLVQKANAEGGIVTVFLREDLERHQAAQLLVHGKIDSGGGPVTDLRLHLKSGKLQRHYDSPSLRTRISPSIRLPSTNLPSSTISRPSRLTARPWP
jgi:hypothetical protein